MARSSGRSTGSSQVRSPLKTQGEIGADRLDQERDDQQEHTVLDGARRAHGLSLDDPSTRLGT